MDTRITKLIEAFQSRGWRLEGPIDISSDWWFSEIIQLISIWRPINTVLYLTLLTDPEIINRKDIWSVGISSIIPDNQHHKFITQLTLNDINRKDLTAIIDNINKMVLIKH